MVEITEAELDEIVARAVRRSPLSPGLLRSIAIEWLTSTGVSVSPEGGHRKEQSEHD